MKEKTPTYIQKKADTDLNIIIATTILALGLFVIIHHELNDFITNRNIPILLRTITIGLMQFSVAGLGITIVRFFRKERFTEYGLNQKNLLLSIILSIGVFIPYSFFLLITGQIHDYFPFQTIGITQEVLASDFPINLIGMMIIIIVWGFFEGFNYVVISYKINMRFPSKNKYLNWGAISCAIICILIHGIIGLDLKTIIEALMVFIIIYGMLMIKQYTGNTWGCIFIFMFLWNAF